MIRSSKTEDRNGSHKKQKFFIWQGPFKIIENIYIYVFLLVSQNLNFLRPIYKEEQEDIIRDLKLPRSKSEKGVN